MPSRALAALACAALALLAASACSRDRGRADPLAADRPVDGGPPVPYAVTIEGDPPAALASLLRQASQAEQLASQPPTSELVIRRRALDDVPRLEAALRSEGYYDGRVSLDVRPPTQPLPGEKPVPVSVSFRVEAGPLYRLADRRVGIGGDPAGYAPPSPGQLGLKEGEPARAQAVLDAEQALLKQARQAGRALAELGPRSTVVDNERRTMDVVLRLVPGPKATFGAVTFKGVSDIEEGFLQRRLPFRRGEAYDPDKVDEAQKQLYDTNLFSTVVLEPAKALDPDGTLPFTCDVTQRATRSIGAGIGYASDTGPNGTLFWEDRNLLDGGERLRVETTLNLLLQDLHATYRKPDFLATDQSLLADAEGKREDTDAYSSLSAGGSLGIEHPFSKRLVGSLGVAYRYVDLEEQGEPAETYGLLSLPGKLSWDFSDSLLNPTRGGRLSLFAAPYYDTLSASRQFLKGQLTTTRYIPLTAKGNLTLALRGSVGALGGVSREEVPADERFYSGGGGSVRGVGYQLAGPLDKDDNPQGGRSLLEVSAEVRYRFTENLGAVLFIDGGSVFDSAYPSLEEPLRWGAGPGVRYYTPIGPLRFDVGIPLNRREGVDDAFQLYLSIGQAF